MFTRSDGSFLVARWGRPLAPVIFGVQDATLATFKGAFEALCQLAGHQMAETDPELGANLMVFVCRSWEELADVPNLDRMIDGFAPLLGRLKAAGANQYRVFRFDADGAIRACFIFLCMDDDLSAVPAAILALSQAVQSIVLWSDTAFTDHSPLALVQGVAVLRPEIASVIRACYDPVLPAVARDPSHALRLAARLEALQ